MEAWQHLQPVIDRIAPLAVEQGMNALTPPERVVLLVWSYSGAVNNGGHASFFYNSYGEHAEETVQALLSANSPDYAYILTQAIGLFPGGQIPRGIDERNDALGALPAESDQVLIRLDDEFYSLGDDELMQRLLNFWNSL